MSKLFRIVSFVSMVVLIFNTTRFSYASYTAKLDKSTIISNINSNYIQDNENVHKEIRTLSSQAIMNGAGEGCLTFSSISSFSFDKTSWFRSDGTIQYLLGDPNGDDWKDWENETLVSVQKGGLFYISLRGKSATFVTTKYQIPTAESDPTPPIDFSASNNVICTGYIESLLDYETVNSGDVPEMGDQTFGALFRGFARLVNTPSFLATELSSSFCYAYMFDNCQRLTDLNSLPATTLSEGCYARMFSNCISIYEAPELPSTSLESDCYSFMFAACRALITAPELPALELEPYCYYNMFSACTALKAAPDLPATSLADGCYYAIFKGCTRINEAPTLPAEELAESCYRQMFASCTSIIEPPTLPAEELFDYCYASMFSGCISLTSAPTLSSETLAYNCYDRMFSNCVSITEAPELPSTTLEDECYRRMFDGCSGITTPPDLPATELAWNCYEEMFAHCSALANAPLLRAEVLERECYKGMFMGCDAITTPPVLPALTLAEGCYYGMFKECVNLIEVPNLPASTLEDSCYAYMFAECTKITHPANNLTTDVKSQCFMYMYQNCKSLRIYSAATINDYGEFSQEWKAVATENADLAFRWNEGMFDGCADTVEVIQNFTYYVQNTCIQINSTNYAYDKKTHKAELNVVWPKSGYNVEYSLDGSVYQPVPFEYINVGDYNIYYKVSTDEYGELLGEFTFSITNSQPMYRMYNRTTTEHLFTLSEKEYNKLAKLGWVKEGKTFNVYSIKTENSVPIYRVFNRNMKGGDHHYTKSSKEVQKLVKLGWEIDFNGKPLCYTTGDFIVYKLYCVKGKGKGRHHYTPKQGEYNKLIKSKVWKKDGDGIAWFVPGYYGSKNKYIN